MSKPQDIEFERIICFNKESKEVKTIQRKSSRNLNRINLKRIKMDLGDVH